MTVDFRATIVTDLGRCISGDVGSNLISDGSGLVATQGKLLMDGIINPARGTAVNLMVVQPQRGVITRFPKPLFVIRALPDVLNRQSEIEIGCRLTLMKNRRDQVVYSSSQYTHPSFAGLTSQQLATIAIPIYAQKVLEYCCDQIGLGLAPGASSRGLTARFMEDEIDLSEGYVDMIGRLLRSESCAGRILPNGRLQVIDLNPQISGIGPVLQQADLYSVEPVQAGNEPPDNWLVTYEAGERTNVLQTNNETPARSFADWTSSQNVSAPQTIRIRYTNASGSEQTASFTSINTSSTVTQYQRYSYTDAELKRQSVEIVTRKTETNTASGASVNSAYVAFRLSRGLSALLPNATETTVTTYEYRNSAAGPVLARETAETRITELELAGSLNVPSYEFYTPSISTFVAARRRITYDTQIGFQGREVTRTTTETWRSFGRRSEGQTAFNEIMAATAALWGDSATASNFTSSAINDMKELIYEGAEISISVGRAPVPQKPVDQKLLQNEASQGEEIRRSVSGVVLFQGAAYNAADNTDTATYDLPFAPDDVFEYVNGVRRLIPGGARAAARRFGDTQAALAVGHAFGQNIVTSFDKLPTRDLDPVYIRVAGIEGAFLMDGTSYAWDSNGLVVGADLMLVGVTGYYGAAPPATSWLRLPVPTIGLPKID